MQSDRSFLSPERVVSYFDIPRGSVVADFGAGSGFFAIPLAGKVGPEGKVYAFEVQQDAVERTRSRAKLLHLLQVEAVRANLERPQGTRLKDGVADFVLISSVLNQAEDKDEMLKEAARIIKPGRYLALIEWDQSPALAGPPLGSRIQKSKAKEIIESAGFLLDREFEAGSHHYGLLFRKR